MATITVNTDWMENYRKGELTGTQSCKICGTETMRPKIIFDPDGTSAVYCKRCVPAAHLAGTVDTAKNPFQNFTLEHARDERGKKITVNSIAELRAAEKKHGFALAAACNDGGDTSTPPQHDKGAGNIAKDYEWKWARDPEARSRTASQGVSAGITANSRETLAHHPNPV